MSLGRFEHVFALVFIGLLLGLAGGAVAQVPGSMAPQTITVQPDHIHWDEVPDELPGTYHGLIVVRTTASGGACLCAPGTTTTVDLDVSAEEPITETVVSPSSYAVDWWAQPEEQRQGHEKIVQITLYMDRTDADLVTFELHSDGSTGSPIHPTQGLDSAYAVPLPEDVHDEAPDQQTSQEGDQGNASQDAEASTQSASDPGDLQQAAVPGMGAIAAVTALGAIAWRRRGP